MKVEISDTQQLATGLDIGEIGVIPLGQSYEGAVVMRTYTGYVDLANPRNTWDGNRPSWASLLRPLPKGTKVILTV